MAKKPAAPQFTDAQLWLLRAIKSANALTEPSMILLARQHRPDLARQTVLAARAFLTNDGLLEIAGDEYLITPAGQAALQAVDAAKAAKNPRR